MIILPAEIHPAQKRGALVDEMQLGMLADQPGIQITPHTDIGTLSEMAVDQGTFGRILSKSRRILCASQLASKRIQINPNRHIQRLYLQRIGNADSKRIIVKNIGLDIDLNFSGSYLPQQRRKIGFAIDQKCYISAGPRGKAVLVQISFEFRSARLGGQL